MIKLLIFSMLAISDFLTLVIDGSFIISRVSTGVALSASISVCCTRPVDVIGRSAEVSKPASEVLFLLREVMNLDVERELNGPMLSAIPKPAPLG